MGTVPQRVTTPAAELKGHTDVVGCVAFSPFDGDLLASASWDRTVRIWQLSTQSCTAILEGHTDDVGVVVFSRLDPNLIVTGSRDKTARVFNVATKECIAVFSGHTDFVGAVGFSQYDRDLVISGSHDATLMVWSVSEGTGPCRGAPLTGHTDWISCVKCSPFDGDILASASHDATIRLWSIDSGVCNRVLQGHELHVNSLCFSPVNGDLLVSGASDNTIRFWSITGGTCTRLLTASGNVNSVDISPLEPDMLISSESDDTIRVWSMATGHCGLILEGNSHSGAASPANKGTIVSGGSDNTVKVWDWESAAAQGELQVVEECGSLTKRSRDAASEMAKAEQMAATVRIDNENRLAAARAHLHSIERQAATQAAVHAQKLAVLRKEQHSTGRQLELFRQTVSQHGIDSLNFTEVQELLSQLNVSVALVTLERNLLTGKALGQLSENEMNSFLGIRRLGDRRRLTQALKRLQEGQGFCAAIRDESKAVGALGWAVDQVAEWLKTQGLAEIAPLVKYHKIDGLCLLGLQRDDLEVLGIRSVPMKTDMLSAIAILRRQSYAGKKASEADGFTDI